jgi:hypothetical protein
MLLLLLLRLRATFLLLAVRMLCVSSGERVLWRVDAVL